MNLLFFFNLRVLKTGFLNLPGKTDPLHNLISPAEPFPKFVLSRDPILIPGGSVKVEILAHTIRM